MGMNYCSSRSLNLGVPIGIRLGYLLEVYIGNPKDFTPYVQFHAMIAATPLLAQWFQTVKWLSRPSN